MLYLHPEYVDLSKVECVKMDPTFTKYPDIVTYDEFGSKTPNGILGDATIASREKGEAIVTKCVDRIVSFMKETFDC